MVWVSDQILLTQNGRKHIHFSVHSAFRQCPKTVIASLRRYIKLMTSQSIFVKSQLNDWLLLNSVHCSQVPLEVGVAKMMLVWLRYGYFTYFLIIKTLIQERDTMNHHISTTMPEISSICTLLKVCEFSHIC